MSLRGFPGGTVVKNSSAQRDADSKLGLRRSPGVGNDNLLQYSCLGHFIDREASWVTVHGIAKSQTRLSD